MKTQFPAWRFKSDEDRQEFKAFLMMNNFKNEDDGAPIDVSMCDKCKAVRIDIWGNINFLNNDDYKTLVFVKSIEEFKVLCFN